MISAVVEDGGVMAAVSEERDRDAPRDGEEDIVDVVVPVYDQTPCNETRSEEGKHHREPFPKAGVVVREGLQLRVQVKG